MRANKIQITVSSVSCVNIGVCPQYFCYIVGLRIIIYSFKCDSTAIYVCFIIIGNTVKFIKHRHRSCHVSAPKIIRAARFCIRKTLSKDLLLHDDQTEETLAWQVLGQPDSKLAAVSVLSKDRYGVKAQSFWIVFYTVRQYARHMSSLGQSSSQAICGF